jgi:hypothetical protein
MHLPVSEAIGQSLDQVVAVLGDADQLLPLTYVSVAELALVNAYLPLCNYEEAIAACEEPEVVLIQAVSPGVEVVLFLEGPEASQVICFDEEGETALVKDDLFNRGSDQKVLLYG